MQRFILPYTRVRFLSSEYVMIIISINEIIIYLIIIIVIIIISMIT